MGASLNLKMITKDSDLKQGVNPETKAVVAGRAFNVRSANEVLEDASGQEIPNMLFGEFIFEGELTALYAPTNRGKSFLALHIAHLIASGKSLYGLENEAEPQKVVFFDLELSDLQFQARYSEEYKDAKGKRASGISLIFTAIYIYRNLQHQPPQEELTKWIGILDKLKKLQKSARLKSYSSTTSLGSLIRVLKRWRMQSE